MEYLEYFFNFIFYIITIRLIWYLMLLNQKSNVTAFTLYQLNMENTRQFKRFDLFVGRKRDEVSLFNVIVCPTLILLSITLQYDDLEIVVRKHTRKRSSENFLSLMDMEYDDNEKSVCLRSSF